MPSRQCKNRIRRYDEYYTRYEHVKNIFERYIPCEELKDKIIYLPCDSDKSNFVIYLKEHKEDIGYKELIYTWDDYNTHIDLFEYCDIIITNPPFSKIIKEFIPILNKVNKKFFILGGAVTVTSYYDHFDDKNIKYVSPVEWFDFIMPDDAPEGYSSWPRYLYISNMNIKSYRPRTKDRKREFKDIYAELPDRKIKNYDRLSEIPDDEYDEILVPCTVLYEHWREIFDIIDIHKFRDVIRYTDGKNKYIRILVKRK